MISHSLRVKLLRICRLLLALSANRTCDFFHGSALWYSRHGPHFRSACLSLIFCKFIVGAARFAVDAVHPLAPAWLRACAQAHSGSSNSGPFVGNRNVDGTRLSVWRLSCCYWSRCWVLLMCNYFTGVTYCHFELLSIIHNKKSMQYWIWLFDVKLDVLCNCFFVCVVLCQYVLRYQTLDVCLRTFCIVNTLWLPVRVDCIVIGILKMEYCGLSIYRVLHRDRFISRKLRRILCCSAIPLTSRSLCVSLSGSCI